MTEQPPSAPEPTPAEPGRGSSYNFDANQTKAAFQGAHKFDLAIIVIGVVAFFASFMPFYTFSFTGLVSGSFSAWHGFFGWFGILCCLVGAVVVALAVLGIAIPVPTRLTALAAFGLGALCLILALFIFPGGGCGGFDGCDTGHGFGYWLALLLALGGTVLSFLRYQGSSATTTV